MMALLLVPTRWANDGPNDRINDGANVGSDDSANVGVTVGV